MNTWAQRIVPYRLLSGDASAPETQHKGDAGADLRAAESVLVEAGGRARVDTGVTVELPENFVGLVWSRSGLSSEHGIEVGAGCIDQGYRGSVEVVLYNHSEEDYAVQRGDRIAQLLLVPVARAVFIPSDELSESVRETQGFGSTGT